MANASAAARSTSTQPDPKAATKGGEVPQADSMDRFQKIETERFMYNADKCGGAPVIGILVECIPMPPIKGRAWDAFVMKLTEPTKAVNRQKEIVTVGKGCEVLVPATHQLATFLTRAASQPDVVFEVFIKPDKKLDIGGGQSMWQYDLRRTKKPFSRAANGLLPIAANVTPRALPPHQAAAGGEPQTEEEIPF